MFNINIPFYSFLLTIFSIVLLCHANAEPTASASNAMVKQTSHQQAPEFHLAVLEKLKQSESVIPEKPRVHPLKTVYNREAVIPPLCYTKTEGKYNPCYVCHQNPVKGRENTMADGRLQQSYDFSDKGFTNHWKNLFEDRSRRVAKITDSEILDWIKQDNYSELAGRLLKAKFKGWIPDLNNLQEGSGAFYENGFAKDGSGWVAFNYKPFPSTFWPTNGSTDDTMIRLDKAYRHDESGFYSEDVYRANLAIVEANIKGLKSISVKQLNESRINKDLDGDGQFGFTSMITVLNGYVGKAKDHLFQPGIYPAYTEFLHTVRYLGIAKDQSITNSRRIKEVRYMKKWVAYPQVALREYYRDENYGKDEGRLPSYSNLDDKGLDNGMGWSIQGFIEGRNGRLRAYTYEENMACMGCHSSIGATIDKTFSFPRKVDGATGWGYINLKGMPDAPTKGESRGEILTYLKRVGGGGEFRSNPEMQQRWFETNGKVNETKVSQARDVYQLITPSVERALLLNKAYRVIVDDQDFIYGRDATIKPPTNVYDKIDKDNAPTLTKDLFFNWNILLDWRTENHQNTKQSMPVSEAFSLIEVKKSPDQVLLIR